MAYIGHIGSTLYHISFVGLCAEVTKKTNYKHAYVKYKLRAKIIQNTVMHGLTLAQYRKQGFLYINTSSHCQKLKAQTQQSYAVTRSEGLPRINADTICSIRRVTM